MRVDHAAAARANLRAQASDPEANATRLLLSRVEINARHARMRHLSMCMRACMACAKRHTLGPNGTTLECAALANSAEGLGFHLTVEQRAKAKACPIPGIYADIHQGKRDTLTEGELLPLIPFEPASWLVAAVEEEAAAAETDAAQDKAESRAEAAGGKRSTSDAD